MQSDPPTTITIRLTEEEALAYADVERFDGGPVDGSLAREWILERLGSLPRVFRAEPWPSESDLQGPEHALRVAYRPNDVWALFVAFDEPAGRGAFYRMPTPLREAVRAGLSASFGELPQGDAFLDWFKEQSLWLLSLGAPPSRGRKGRPRKDEVDDETLRLARLLRELRPDVVIVIGSGIAPMVRRAEELAMLPAEDVRVLPYPIRQWRAPFVDELSRLLLPATDAEPPRPTDTDLSLHAAMLDVLAAGPLSAREIANRIAARGLYRRRDGRYPPASQVAARARQCPDLFLVTPSGITAR
jgi:hypothetical protein